MQIKILIAFIAVVVLSGVFCFGEPVAESAGKADLLYSSTKESVHIQDANLKIDKTAGKLSLSNITEIGPAPDIQLTFLNRQLGLRATITIYEAPQGTTGPKVLLDSNGKPKLADNSKNPYAVFELTNPSEAFETEYKRVVDGLEKNFPLKLMNKDGKPLRKLIQPNDFEGSPIAYEAMFEGTGEFHHSKLKDMPWFWRFSLVVIGKHFVKIHLEGPAAADLDLLKASIALKSGLNWSAEVADEPPKDGKHVKYYENGQKKTEIHYKNGEPDGLLTVWYENGKKRYEGNFKNGKGDGPLVLWHENGQKKQEGHWKDGERDGLLTDWHENGQKEQEGHWKDGERDGLLTDWYENGQKKLEGYFKNGKEDGPLVLWHENGQKEREGRVKNGKEEGLWTDWYENGQKKLEGYFKNGKEDGPLVFWHENGQKEYEGNYKNGKEDGLWTQWDGDGNKTQEIQYKNGIEISRKEF